MNILKRAFSWVLNCYDQSLFERTMKKISAFFKNSSEDSVFLGFFKNHFSKGTVWEKSFVAKAVNLPLEKIGNSKIKNSQKLNSLKKNSIFLSLLNSKNVIPLRFFGKLLFCLTLGAVLGISVGGNWGRVSAILIFTMFLLSFVLLMIDLPANTIAGTSRILKIIKGFFFIDDENIVSPQKAPKNYLEFFIPLFFIGGLLGLFDVVAGLLGAVLAIGFLVILKKPVLCVYIFIPLSAILPTMVMAFGILVAFFAFLLHLLFDKDTSYKKTVFQPWILLFLVLSLVSSLLGANPTSSIKIFFIYVIFTMSYVLITNLITTKKQFKILLVLIALATAVVALYGIYQNFFLASTTQSWVDDEMFSDIKTRVYATLENPNVLGEYFIMMIPLAFSLIISAKGNFKKALYSGLNILMFACLIYTWSRGAWIGVVISLLFFVLLKDRRWLILCVAGLLLMPSVLPETIIQRLFSIGNVKDSSTAYRVAVWIGSLRLIKDYWLLGIGIGADAFLSVYPHYALGGADFALHSHNFYLQWIVDMGVLGILTYFGIILTGLFGIVKNPPKDRFIKNSLLAMSGGIFGYLFHGMAENLWYNYRMILIFWVYFGILQTGIMLGKEETDD